MFYIVNDKCVKYLTLKYYILLVLSFKVKIFDSVIRISTVNNLTEYIELLLLFSYQLNTYYYH